jgi:hypothetical protein
MKFIHYLEKISSVDVYGIASFVIFSLFFIVMTVWALKADKRLIDELKNIPLNL